MELSYFHTLSSIPSLKLEWVFDVVLKVRKSVRCRP